MLEIKDIHAYYATSHILQGVSFEVPEGKCVALLGRNGAGKTTTIHTVSGLILARRGSIRFAGRELKGLPPHRIARLGIGLIPQGRRIFPSLTVRENLIMSARNGKDGDGESWGLERVGELFPVLKERANSMGGQLSGGQQQMLAIGRALMTNPRLVLMDEPSEGLAPVIIEQMGGVISRLKETSLSILLVEQNVSLACKVADDILIMNKGRIVWNGTPDELLADEEIQHKHLGV